MKYTLIIMRHAKTELMSKDHRDFSRNLTERGHQDATLMGNRLRAQQLMPDLILASPANRTQQTAHIISGLFGYETSAIQSPEQLYNSSSETLLGLLETLPDTVRTCWLIAHNPGVSQLVYELQREIFVGELPTAGTAVLQFEAEGWHDIGQVRKTLVLFDTPRNKA